MTVAKYLIAGLLAVVAVVVWLYRGASLDLTLAKSDLATAHEVNESNQQTIDRLQRNLEATHQVLAQWQEDITAVDALRDATQQAVKEALRNATDNEWAAVPVPPALWSLLRNAAAGGQNRDGDAPASGGTAAGLPANGGPRERDKR
jgi:hypothetical protein